MLFGLIISAAISSATRATLVSLWPINMCQKRVWKKGYSLPLKSMAVVKQNDPFLRGAGGRAARSLPTIPNMPRCAACA